jgi:hypothetical protein
MVAKSNAAVAASELFPVLMRPSKERALAKSPSEKYRKAFKNSFEYDT